MNADRRKQLAAIIERIESCVSDLEMLRDEEQEYYDNMPEGIQSGERGETAEQAVQNMDEAIEALQSASDCISNASSGS